MAAVLVGAALLSAFLQVAFHRLASPQGLDGTKCRKLLILGLMEVGFLSPHAVTKLLFPCTKKNTTRRNYKKTIASSCLQNMYLKMILNQIQTARRLV